MITPPPTDLVWVASRITKPQNLTPSAFCDWYENTHIQEVTALSGIPSAARYELLPGFGFPGALAHPWLTLYEMREVGFRKTEEFRGLNGQSRPDGRLLERVFRNAEFDTRFWRCVQVHEGVGVKKGGYGLLDGRTTLLPLVVGPVSMNLLELCHYCGNNLRFRTSVKSMSYLLISVLLGPAPLIISAALTPSPSAEADFDAWYRREHIPMISQCPGYVRTRRYRLVDASLLHEFDRRESPAPSWLALHEFEGAELPMAELLKCDETEWSKRVIAGLEKMEAGFYRLKRVYEEDVGAKL